MRLIDADALQERLKKKKPDPAAPRYVEGFNDALLRFKSMVHSAPTIRLERKKGKWEPIVEVNELGEPYQAGVYCNKCGERNIYEPNFCSNCGSDMRDISEDPEDACSECEYYDLEDNDCRVFECFGIDCPKLPCEEGGE